MELIIKIPDYEYEDLTGLYKFGLDRPTAYKTYIEKICVEAIANGTPLPEGHDRLVEARAVIKALFGKQTIDDVPTIIEADKENADGTGN